LPAIDAANSLFRFEELVGQDLPTRVLRRAIARGQLAHAILLHGESGLGIERAALTLARASLCQRATGDPCDDCPSCLKTARLDHPDLRFVLPLPTAKGARDDEDPDKRLAQDVLEALKRFGEQPWRAPEVKDARQILVEQARHLKSWAQLKSYEGGRRVAVIWQAERMGVQAQNALLKLLEEPPADLLLVLSSEAPDSLLPTILSRCQALRLRPAPEGELAQAFARRAGFAELVQRAQRAGLSGAHLARLAGGNPGRAWEIVEAAEAGAGDGPRLAEWEALAAKAREQRRPAPPRPAVALWDASALLRDILGRPQDLHARILAFEAGKDRLRLARLLADLQDWLQDAELLRALPDGEGVALVRNAHQLETLQRFAADWCCERPDLAAADLERAIRDCMRNVHLFGVLVTLAHELQGHFRKSVRQEP
jgi:DNA polymerase III delta' subunit